MRNRAVVVAVVFLLAGGFFIGGCAGKPGSGSAIGSGGHLTAEQRFTLKNLNNENTGLDQVLANNKAVLIDFWATWCGYCVEEMPDLIRLQEANKGRGFTVLAVNVGESSRQASAFSDKMKLNFPIVLDEDMAVSQKYGLVGIPTSILVNSTGKILGVYHEFSHSLEADVEKALA